jgi:hypothetical protein
MLGLVLLFLRRRNRKSLDEQFETPMIAVFPFDNGSVAITGRDTSYIDDTSSQGTQTPLNASSYDPYNQFGGHTRSSGIASPIYDTFRTAADSDGTTRRQSTEKARIGQSETSLAPVAMPRNRAELETLLSEVRRVAREETSRVLETTQHEDTPPRYE